MSRTFSTPSVLVCSALLLSSLSTLATAQPAPGERVRVAAGDERRFVGRLVSLDPTTIAVRVDSGEWRSPSAAVRVLEVRARRSRLRGALVGSLVGFGAGAIVGYTTAEECEREFIGGECLVAPVTNAGAAAILGVLGGALGAGAGALVWGGERWKRSEPRRVGAVVRPTGVGLAFAF